MGEKGDIHYFNLKMTGLLAGYALTLKLKDYVYSRRRELFADKSEGLPEKCRKSIDKLPEKLPKKCRISCQRSA